MNLSDVDVLKVYVMISPLVVFGVGFGVFLLTGRFDRRERHPAP
jgi:hypothetical protein